jgi:hypothetical protein
MHNAPNHTHKKAQAFKKWKVLTVLIDFDIKFLRKNGFNRFSVI